MLATRTSAANPGGANIASQFVAYAACMCLHGLSGYPDPHTSASGNQVQVTISPGSLNPDSPAFKTADGACHHLLPNGGTPAASGPHEQAQGLQVADCMRSHGVPNFPDADRDGAFTLPSTMNQPPNSNGQRLPARTPSRTHSRSSIKVRPGHDAQSYTAASLLFGGRRGGLPG